MLLEKCSEDNLVKITLQYFLSVISCSDPGPIQNGFPTPTVGPYRCGTRITYACKQGFELQGRPLLCGSNGQFIGTPPKCIQSCKYQFFCFGL